MLAKSESFFPEDMLFILNGAGHNPIVVAGDANIDQEVSSTLRVCLQNQRQDCAAPNIILVQQDAMVEFQKKLLSRLRVMEG